MNIKIDPEFQNLIPPLSADELNQLEQNIISEGKCRDTVKVWKDIIIDGYHRYEICQKHGIPFEVQNINFASRKDAILWIIEHQLGRRNLSSAMRIELVYRRAKLPRKTIAAQANVSKHTVYKYMKIRKTANSALLESVKKGQKKIDEAYKGLTLTTKTVTKLSELTPDKNSPAYVKAVFENIEKIKKYYQFVSDNAKRITEATDVEKRLIAQYKAVRGLTGYLGSMM